MCGGDDHLAWKHPVSSKVCRGLRVPLEATIASTKDSLTHPFYLIEPPQPCRLA